jgi:hypothetical protein
LYDKTFDTVIAVLQNKNNTTLSVKFQNIIEKSQKEVKIETSSTQMHERLISWIGVQALQ